MDTGEAIESYWNEKYRRKKNVWGNTPSLTAKYALSFIETSGIHLGFLLDVGCGYGRDSVYFEKNGFDVVGIDIAGEAIRMAGASYPTVRFRVADLKRHGFEENTFDFVFSNFFFHLISEHRARREMLAACRRILKPGGYFFTSVSSVNDPDFSTGERLGENIVKNQRGVVKVYYDEALIHRDFNLFELENLQVCREEHTHDKPHYHESYFIAGKKILPDT